MALRRRYSSSDICRDEYLTGLNIKDWIRWDVKVF